MYDGFWIKQIFLCHENLGQVPDSDLIRIQQHHGSGLSEFRSEILLSVTALTTARGGVTATPTTEGVIMNSCSQMLGGLTGFCQKS